MPIRTTLCVLLLLSVVLSACGIGNVSLPGTPPDQAPANAITISIAYSPEKEGWLTDRIAAFNAQRVALGEQPVFVEGLNKSSGVARTEIRNGQLDVTVWSPSASTWLEVLKQETGNEAIAVSNQPLVLTPVVISMWRPMAEAMGWPDEPIGWGDMLALIEDEQGWGSYGHPEWGRFSWGHTDPEVSTTALSTLIAEFYAATGKQRGLTVEDVTNETSLQFIRDLGQGIKHYGYNTLVFSENMRKFGLSYISAFPMEEITLIEFNKSGPPEQLVAIYPEEGTFWHDNPFIIMASASTEQREAAELFYDYLLTEASQQLAMSYGFRPANVNVPLGDPISEVYGVQRQGVQNVLEVPPAEVLVAIKDAWEQNRKRADILLVVDISGSMEGEKLALAKAGLQSFLLRLLPEDRVGLVVFASTATVAVPPAPLSENLIELQDTIQNLFVLDNTAMYDGLALAHTTMNELPPTDEERIRAIVLLSDGVDNESTITLEQLAELYGEGGVSIFPVAYGDDADVSGLERIAEFSRTIVVQGSTGDINQIFENLSRYF
ncbi:MAG: VWA domain-containing protein [Chloroflexaceae bacterium]|nr:VWA domain-containing protein [Chloroflexaceae bacterium]NJL34474.1 VWA domain-containing protein [Chloroflexaceae bacterium]NJO05305.1 VWA domain-containing protein [Chloroflexaceae bacterium]